MLYEILLTFFEGGENNWLRRTYQLLTCVLDRKQRLKNYNLLIINIIIFIEVPNHLKFPDFDAQKAQKSL